MGVQCHGEERRKEGTHKDGALSEQDAWWKCRKVTFPNLDTSEGDDEQPEPKKTTPDFRIGPGICGAAPLEGKKEADDGADEEEGSDQVDLTNLFSQCQSAVFALGIFEKEEDCCDSDRTDGEVDVEAPAPGYTWTESSAAVEVAWNEVLTISECSSKDGSDDRSDSKH